MVEAVNIFTIARDHDAYIYEWDLGHIDGCVVHHERRYHIAVNSSLSPYAKQWTIAHEIGHIFDDSVGGVRTLIAERRADEIALDILIPDESFRSAIEEFGGSYEYLCPLFGCSPETIEKKAKKFFNPIH